MARPSSRRERRTVRANRPSARGGMLVVGGPPFQGKTLLAARLAEHLPNSIKLEAVDNLARSGECWYPRGPDGECIVRPTARLLAVARRIWKLRAPSAPPVIVLSARFATPSLRRRARSHARVNDMPFLFVEARSSNIRSMRRIAKLTLEAETVVRRFSRFEKAMAGYRPIDDAEAETLDCMRFDHVLGDLDAAVTLVLRRWLKE